MKTIKELLTLTRDNVNSIKKKNGIGLGICAVVVDLRFSRKINEKEHKVLQDFLNKNLPRKRYPLDLAYMKGNAYCWKPGVVQGRKKWLTKQIDLL